MTLNHDITIIRNCTTSQQLFSVAESFSHQISDLEDMLKDAEYDWNWGRIQSLLEQLAVTRYAYKFAHDAACYMEDEEHEIQLSAEINDAMMGDRV